VLDAACGGGWGTAVLAEAATAVGVDLSPAAIAAARREYDEKAEFVEGDLRELPFADGEFDSLVCFEAIAHVDDPAQAIAGLHRVLRPGGLLLISAPNRGTYPPGNPLHLSELSSSELEGLLRRRFANVAIHRQQTYFASLLCDEATLAHGDPEAPISPRTIKLAGGPAGSELHAVAVATDEELPPAPSWLAIGEELEYAEQQRELEEWRQRVVRAEAEALALRRELRDARQS
jgi:SAM-dependent methyltransferase